MKARPAPRVGKSARANRRQSVAADSGSRGARALCDPEGTQTPQPRLRPMQDYRFRAEHASDRERRNVVRLEDGAFLCEARPIRHRRARAG
ncbi:MAG: hypothetical protein ACLPSW_30365 [Roseiarcus sp.]